MKYIFRIALLKDLPDAVKKHAKGYSPKMPTRCAENTFPGQLLPRSDLGETFMQRLQTTVATVMIAN